MEPGRVTPSSNARSSPAATDREAPVGQTTRYTPPAKRRGIFRPTWHKVVGGLSILAGLGVFVANDLEWLGVHVMPGGHNELYAGLGVVIAATSMWWFGWFDRSETRW